MKHLIYTRFGIGILREAALQRRLGILKASLYPSLAGQTAPVHWLIVADARAPASVIEGLEALRAAVPNLTVKTIDPLGDGGMNGFRKPFLEEVAAGDRVVIVSRVDDDDALHRAFSATVRAAMQGLIEAGARFPIAATWPQGLHIDVANARVRGIDRPWAAQNQAVAIDLDAPLFNIMGTHWNIGRKAAAQGGSAHVMPDTGPRLWAWLIRGDSVTNEYSAGRPPRGTALPEGGLADFGVDPARLLAAYNAPGVNGIDLVAVDGERGSASRLGVKYHCLTALHVIEERMRQPTEGKSGPSHAELDLARKTLASLFYSI